MEHRHVPSLASVLRAAYLSPQGESSGGDTGGVPDTGGGEARDTAGGISEVTDTGGSETRDTVGGEALRRVMRGEADVLLVGRCLLVSLPLPGTAVAAAALGALLPMLPHATSQIAT